MYKIMFRDGFMFKVFQVKFQKFTKTLWTYYQFTTAINVK